MWRETGEEGGKEERERREGERGEDGEREGEKEKKAGEENVNEKSLLSRKCNNLLLDNQVSGVI